MNLEHSSFSGFKSGFMVLLDEFLALDFRFKVASGVLVELRLLYCVARLLDSISWRIEIQDCQAMLVDQLCSVQIQQDVGGRRTMLAYGQAIHHRTVLTQAHLQSSMFASCIRY